MGRMKRPAMLAAAAVAALVVGVGLWRRGKTPAPTGPPGHFVEALDATSFRRGNLHTHTTNSDGGSSPEDVTRWYRDHGYAFLAITDHDHVTESDALRALEGPGFILVPGEEITMRVGGVPIHVNALCHRAKIDGGDRPTIEAALRGAVQEVRSQGGVALVNHPNFEWALRAPDLRHADGAQLLEIWSGHPFVRPDGDALHASAEEIWDSALSSGQTFAGVAVDDMHYLDVGPELAGPGRAWVEVFASELSSAAICEALARGRLYASNGASLRRIAVTPDELLVEPAGGDVLVEFVGKGGKLLQGGHAAKGAPATYRLRGGEVYVRARIREDDGKRAWTQAYRVATPDMMGLDGP